MIYAVPFNFRCTFFFTFVYRFVVSEYIFVCSSYFMSETVIAVLSLSQLNECIDYLGIPFQACFRIMNMVLIICIPLTICASSPYFCCRRVSITHSSKSIALQLLSSTTMLHNSLNQITPSSLQLLHSEYPMLLLVNYPIILLPFLTGGGGLWYLVIHLSMYHILIA